MQVLDEQHDRPLGRELRQELDPRLVQAVAGLERMQIAGDVEPEREAEDLAAAEPLGAASGESLSRIPSCSRRISPSARR